MDEDTFDRWMYELRSGKHDKCVGHLRCEFGMCALGVLCDVVDPKGWTPNEYALSSAAPGYAWHGLEIEPLAPEVGLTFEQVAYVARISDHDNGRLTFAEVAYKLERRRAEFVTPAEEAR